MFAELPPTFIATRDALHALAEHVVCVAYFRATTHIGLRPAPRGFGTPLFGDDERVRVDGTALVHERAREVRRHELTTVAAAAAFVGVPAGAPAVFTPSAPLDAEAPLAIDRDAALALAGWYALGGALLNDLRAAQRESSTEPQIWPEHFDLACEIGDADAGTRANFGASPGDAAIAEPYLYVGPHDAARRTGALGTHPWGAAITYTELGHAGEAGAAGRRFFEEAVSLLTGER